MSEKKKLSIGALVEPYGTHAAAWLADEPRPGASTDLGYFVRLAQTCERGKLDFYFIADTPAARTDDLKVWSRWPMFMNQLEPITLLTALAGATSHIGLAATASTSFFEPYNLARQFASLDHISGGRAGWNVVTSANDYAARNFGHEKLPQHGERYVRAKEFVDIVKDLWDTWEDDAFIDDREQGLTFRPEAQHAVHFDGKHLKVHGALNVARPPQGHPVVIQASASEAGLEMAAETAECVFGSATGIDEAIAYYENLKGRMAKFGRDRDSLKILSGANIVVADTKEEAQALWDGWMDLVHPEVDLLRLKTDLETDLSDLPLDEPVPLDRIPKEANFHKSYFEAIANMIREGLTLRQIGRKFRRNTTIVCGSPTDIADMMEEWVDRGACDGFMVTFPVVPSTLEAFVDKVIPELQRRGRFRLDYEATTLRGHLGLPRPANRHVAAPVAAASAAE